MHPKVLFIDAMLHKQNATAITLSNLFAAWPKDNLSMIGPPTEAKLSLDSGYANVYALGRNDFYHKFPLGIILKAYNSLRNKFSKKKVQSDSIETIQIRSSSSVSLLPQNQNHFLKAWGSWLFRALGLHHLLFRQTVSNELKAWIQRIDPDYIYAVLSTRHSIHFALKLVKEFNKPVVVHIMDDWPAIIGEECMFGAYWNKTINHELGRLLNIAHKRVAISNLMAEEYKGRFGGDWGFFHNPIDTKKWIPFQKTDFAPNLSKVFTFGYLGRIGKGNEASIKLFAETLLYLNDTYKLNTELHIFSPQQLPDEIERIDSVVVSPKVAYADVPKVLAQFAFMLIPFSFDSTDFKFTRLSIPTKLSEYLISGVPVIILASQETALSRFATEHNCAFVIDTNNKITIANKVYEIICNIPKQQEISRNAKNVAMSEFSTEVVSERFKALFSL